MIVCNKTTIIEYDDESCSEFKASIVFGILGLGLLTILSLAIYFYYISYNFLEKNLLKRKFELNLLCQIILKFLFVLFYHL